MRCQACGNLNLPHQDACGKCGKPLNLAATFETAAQRQEAARRALGSVPLESRSAEGETKRQVSACAFCHGVFGPDDLYDVAGKKVCEGCLPRAEKDHPDAEAKGPSLDQGRHDKRYFKERLVAEKNIRSGHATTGTTALWPSCHRHRDRRTNDVCTSCRKPICAMCQHRSGSSIYCVECFGRAPNRPSGMVSMRFSGFSGSFVETVKDALFNPSIFFGNLPSKGDVVRPFLFGAINWSIGATVLIALMWAVLWRDQAFLVEEIHFLLVIPAAFGGLFVGLTLAVLGWVPYHLLARLVGGEASARKSMKMFNLASAACLFVIIPPFLGLPVAFILILTTLLRAIESVYAIDLGRAFLVCLIASTFWLGGIFLLGSTLLFSNAGAFSLTI